MMLRTTVTDSLSEMGQKLTNFRLICEVTELLMECYITELKLNNYSLS